MCEILVKELQALPTYLKVFFEEDLKCRIVHKNVLTKLSYAKEEINDSCDQLDLTGNPLQIDLNEDEKFECELMPSLPYHNWTSEESLHFPLSTEEARKILNTKFNVASSLIPTFCIVNGSNREKTILIIGSWKYQMSVSTYLVKFLGTFSQDELSVNNLLKMHVKYAKQEPTTFQFKRIYHIFGIPINEQNTLENSTSKGSIFLETSWNILKDIEPTETKVEMKLKVVSGNKNSLLRFLWDELSCLMGHLKILENVEINNENTEISENYSSNSALTDKLSSLCCMNNTMKKVKGREDLDLNNLRDEKVLDNLWRILKDCHTLQDLKQLLSFFFKMVKAENFKNDDMLSVMVKDFLKINDYITKLTFFDCLQFLVNVGFEKLKNDYYSILNFYYPLHQERLEKKWSEYHQDQHKKIGSIILKKSISLNQEKFGFLLNLHDIAEIIVFLKFDAKNSSDLPQCKNNFRDICEDAYRKFMFKKLKESYHQKIKVLDITLQLNSTNDYYKNKNPTTSIFQFNSKLNQSLYRKTVFHISQQTIFPPCIYDYCKNDDSEELCKKDSDKNYHLSFLLEDHFD